MSPSRSTGSFPSSQTITAGECAALIESISGRSPGVYGLIQRWRPYTCPFEVLVGCVRDGARVLDIGCGAGLFLALLTMLRQDIQGVGVDASASAVSAARNLADGIARTGHPSDLQFLVASEARQWPAGEFDVVALIDVMHHIPPNEQRTVLEQAAARVAPGGILLYKDMCVRPLWRRVANRLHDLVLARQWVHELDPASACAVVEPLGFRLRQAGRLNRLWYGHDLRVMERLPQTR